MVATLVTTDSPMPLFFCFFSIYVFFFAACYFDKVACVHLGAGGSNGGG